MFDKRLINIVNNAKKYISLNVLFQWFALLCNVVIIFGFGIILSEVIKGTVTMNLIIQWTVIIMLGIGVRFILFMLVSKMSYYSSEQVKLTLREKIYQKVLLLGNSYQSSVNTSEVVQVAVEGVDQLEIYFGKYLPQFFYSLLAPLTLFVILSFVSFKSALILLLCVPLIPASIVLVQKFAKKLLNKYWSSYTTLGDSFLENLQGLTTLKIYGADHMKQEQMNVQAENFRKVTMKVLIMQLNSITIMDLIAYGGAALGIILAVSEYLAGNINFLGCFVIILLAAEFFIPLRLLGSFFHIAMNGMAASDKIFRLLDLEVPSKGTEEIVQEVVDVEMKQLSFSYEEDRTLLNDINLTTKGRNCIAIVGESGSGKSTIASLLIGYYRDYKGTIEISGIDLAELSEESQMKHITLVNHTSYLFKGSVKENLLMANKEATDSELWSVLEQVELADFLREETGLETMLHEQGSNLSGGQRQRLALARALLHNSSVYLFDEATSNIDVESENKIMDVIWELSKAKKIVLISHRLANVVNADYIYVMEQGKVVEEGTHKELLKKKATYAKLFTQQKELEEIREGGNQYA